MNTAHLSITVVGTLDGIYVGNVDGILTVVGGTHVGVGIDVGVGVQCFDTVLGK